jgi:hypothetical protein
MILRADPPPYAEEHSEDTGTRLVSPTWTWTRILVVPIVALGLTLATGCIPIPVWRSVHFDPAGIEHLPQLPSVTLYQFDDVRQMGGSRIGVRRGYWQGRKTCPAGCRPAQSLIFGPPVGETVTQAFAEGLKARGFTLVDRASERFLAGQSELPTPLAIVGEVNDFWIEYGSSGFGLSGLVRCSVTVRVVQALDASGPPRWEQKYDVREDTEGDALDPLVETLGRALSKVVRDAVNDPNFVAQFY